VARNGGAAQRRQTFAATGFQRRAEPIAHALRHAIAFRGR
jgi:hypothetical protein